MNINDITYTINGAIFEVSRNQKPARHREPWPPRSAWQAGWLRRGGRGWFLICPKGMALNGSASGSIRLRVSVVK
jgi:hypothetical protein